MFPTLEEIKKQEQEKGYASLTQGQKDIFNAPLVLSSNQGEAIHNENVATVDNVSKTILDNKAEQDKFAKEAAAKKVEDERKAAETKALTENIATGEGSNAQGVKGTWQTNPDTGINQFFPEGSTITFDVPEPVENNKLDKEKADLDAQMAALKISQDQITNAYIDSITKRYEGLIEQQKEINRRAYARVQTSGLRSGTARYAPEIQSGILSAEESAGLSKISALESEKMTLIAEANQAKQNKDIEMLDKKIADYNARRKEQNELLKEQKKLADEKAEKQKEYLKKLDNEKKIKELYDSGITDSASIATTLGISLKEVDDAMKIINPDESLAGVSPDLKTFKEFFPDVDITKEEGRQKYLDWQAQVQKAKDKATQTEQTRNLKTSAFAKARPELEKSRGEDGYVDPNVYMRLRNDYAEIIGEPSSFDAVFASYLSPQERDRLGIGKESYSPEESINPFE